MLAIQGWQGAVQGCCWVTSIPTLPQSRVLKLLPGRDIVLQPGGIASARPAAGRTTGSGPQDRSPSSSKIPYVVGFGVVVTGYSCKGTPVPTCGQAGAQVEGWTGWWKKGVIPLPCRASLRGNTQAAAQAGFRTHSDLQEKLGGKGRPGPRSA